MTQDRGRDAHYWAPRTDLDEPDSSIRFLPRVFDGEALVGPGMTDTRRGKPVVGQFRHSIPCEAVLLAAPPKRSTPEVSDIVAERQERPTICGYRIIGEVACNNLPQPVSLFWDSLVHSLPQLRLDFLKLRPHAVAPGLPLKLEGSPSRFSADEGKAQESEGLRSTDAAFLAVGCRMAAELDQAGLGRMDRQRECLEPLTHRIEEATSVALIRGWINYYGRYYQVSSLPDPNITVALSEDF